MGLRTRQIRRGARKGETVYDDPPVLDLEQAAHKKRAQRMQANGYSFYTEGGNKYVMGWRVFTRKGPRSPFNMTQGTIWQVYPDVFRRV